MGTVSYTTVTTYLLANRDGRVRLRKRQPSFQDLEPGEYAFAITVRIPLVRREPLSGSLTAELPVDMDPDAPAHGDLSGPLDLEGNE